MKTQKMKVKDLTGDPANARKHDKKNMDAIKSSLKRFGQQKPIVVDGDGIVVAGNGTLQGAKELGWESIEVVTTQLTGVEATAYAIADNRSSELAEWDKDALTKTLDSLKNDESIDELVTGFSSNEIDDWIASIAEGAEIEGEVEFSECIGENNQYIVLVFNNDLDWLNAQTHFNIKPVKVKRREGGKDKPWRTAMGRVLDGARYITRITKELVE